jgi:hypothetical protein
MDVRANSRRTSPFLIIHEKGTSEEGNLFLVVKRGTSMDWYLWLTLSAVLSAVPGMALSILELIERRQKRKRSKSKPA